MEDTNEINWDEILEIVNKQAKKEIEFFKERVKECKETSEVLYKTTVSSKEEASEIIKQFIEIVINKTGWEF